MSEWVEIPKDKSGLIIGKQGAQINKLKEDYGVDIQMPQKVIRVLCFMFESVTY